jgi:hypothetical protein
MYIHHLCGASAAVVACRFYAFMALHHHCAVIDKLRRKQLCTIVLVGVR